MASKTIQSAALCVITYIESEEYELRTHAENREIITSVLHAALNASLVEETCEDLTL